MTYPTEQATLWLLEGIARLSIGRNEAHQAFAQAVDAADTMLAFAADNVEALDAQAVAYCGLALTGESTLVSDAVETFQRARRSPRRPACSRR